MKHLALALLLVATPAVAEDARHIRCPYGTVPSQFHARVSLVVMTRDAEPFTLGTIDECNRIHFADGLTIDDLKVAIQLNQFAVAERMAAYTKLHEDIERALK